MLIKNAKGVIKVDPTVSAVALANKQFSVGYALAGRRVTLRFARGVMAVLNATSRTLLRTVPNPLTTRAVAYPRGARPAGHQPHQQLGRSPSSGSCPAVAGS